MSPPLQFAAPDAATWTLDSLHFPQPITALGSAVLDRAHWDGFRELAERYGMLVEGVEATTVNRFRYTTLRPLIGGGGSGGPPHRCLVWLAFRLHPQLRRRRKAARAAWRDELWRDDLRRWDEEAKPASIARNLALLAVDVGALSGDELATHIEDCIAQARRLAKQHAWYNGVAQGPIGDFLAHVSSWTGLEGDALLPLFEGCSPMSTGWIPELDDLVTAIRENGDARTLVQSSEDPGKILAQLRAMADPVGAAANRYVAIVGYRIVGGYDVSDPCAIERPELLVSAIRQAVAAPAPSEQPDPEAAAAAVRARVPDEHREQFDALFENARLTFRVRDERALYSDTWGMGILRRALLEAGARLAETGRLLEAEHIVEIAPDEIRPLVVHSAGPSAQELADRVAYRLTHSHHDAPERLGPPASGQSLPLEWLPDDGLQRGTRAMIAITRHITDPPATPAANAAIDVRGRPASAGVFEGTARVVATPAEYSRLRQGDVLVTPGTAPAVSAVLPLIGGIVTDYGGVLSHAGIIAREARIPCVVGCGNATGVIPDGARVRIDGGAGIVRVLN